MDGPGEDLDDPADVEWLAIDTALNDPDSEKLLDRLLAREFRVMYEEDGIIVARRIRKPS